MKAAAKICVLLTMLSSLAFAESKESPEDQKLRAQIQTNTLKTAQALIQLSHLANKNDIIKFSTPVVELGENEVIRTSKSSIEVTSINGEPVAGGMSYKMEFLNDVLFSAKLICLYCVE